MARSQRAGVALRVTEGTEVIGDAGRRWGRWRAARFAAQMNRQRVVICGAHSHHYGVVRIGFGRWRVFAFQNRLERVDG